MIQGSLSLRQLDKIEQTRKFSTLQQIQCRPNSQGQNVVPDRIPSQPGSGLGLRVGNVPDGSPGMILGDHPPVISMRRFKNFGTVQSNRR